jgi:hypothetical protein
VALTALFVLVLSFAVYRVALRLLGGPRLREMLAWLPPLVALVLAFLPQVVIRLTGSVRVDQVPPAVLWTLPPAWFGAIPGAVLGPADEAMRGQALLGVGAFVVGVLLLLGALGRGLLTDLQRLLAVGEGSGPAAPGAARKALPPGPWVRGLLGFQDLDASAGYLLAVGALRQREIRVRVAASLLMPFVLMVVLSWNEATALGPGLGALLLGMATASLLVLALRHEHHAAAWFYGALPIRRHGRFVAGVAAAIALHYVLPTFALLAAASLFFVPDPWVLAVIVLGFLAGAFPLPIVLGRLRDPLFSLPPGPGETEKGLLLHWMVGMLVGAAVLGLALALLEIWPWALLVLTAGAIALLRVMLHSALARLDAHAPWARRYGG